jgi:hypothetical protein
VSETGSGGCLVGGSCLLPGALDPVDACQRCDPSARVNAFSRNVDPDPVGLQCQESRLTRALGDLECRPRLEQRISKAVLRIGGVVDRLDPARPRLTRRLSRDVARLVRAEHRAERTGCAMGTLPAEVNVLVGQFQAYRDLHTPR